MWLELRRNAQNVVSFTNPVTRRYLTVNKQKELGTFQRPHWKIDSYKFLNFTKLSTNSVLCDAEIKKFASAIDQSGFWEANRKFISCIYN